MKILFGLVKDSNTTIEDTILSAYKEKYGEEFTYKKEYYIAGIEKALEDEHFDMVFINERLEVEPISAHFIDKLTDKFNDLRVSLVIDNSHINGELPKKLFSIGAYDCLFKADLLINTVAELIRKERTKKDAKLYYKIDDNETVDVNATGIVAIPDDELDRVLDKFNGATVDTIGELFTIAEKTYQFPQCVYLISILGEDTRSLIQDVCPSQYKKYVRALEREISRVEIKEKIIEIEKIVERVIEKPVEKIKIEKQIVEKEVIKEVYHKPSDYKKVLAFTGTSNSGVTTTIQHMAKLLTDSKVKVAIIDLAANKDMFERNIFNSDNKCEPLLDLAKGLIKPFKINDFCSLYTCSPISEFEYEQNILWRIIDLARKDNDVTLIDISLDKAKEIYNIVDKITIITTQDLSEVKYISKELNKWVDENSIDNNSTKVDFIINKYIDTKNCVNSKEVVECCTYMVSDYLDISENYKIVELTESKTYTVPFDLEIMTNNYKSDYFSVSSDEYVNKIELVVNNLYKLNSTKTTGGLFGKFKKMLK